MDGREGDNQPPVDSSASGTSSAHRRFLDGWFTKDAEEEPVMEPEKTENYFVTDPKTGEGHRNPFQYCWDLMVCKGQWKQSCEFSEPVKETVQQYETWQARISLLLLKILWFMDKPLKSFGHFVEDLLNLVLANDGLFKTLFRALFTRRKLVVRDRESEDYVSINGALDPRFALHVDKSGYGMDHQQDANELIFPGTEYGSRATLDVLVMASKLAYENEACVKKVVTKTWKMNLVGFYNCWNEFHQQQNTQVFLFTDRPENARAIVVAFRGTELFNARDWSTDTDFSWFQVKGLGKVHVGFLEALGLGDRKRMETFMRMGNYPSSQQSTEHKDNVMSGLPADVVEEPLKILAYDDVTKKVKKLMEQNPEAKLFVTGHSLGGALAHLYTTLLFYNSEESVTSRLGALYTFGQPRVGGADYSQYMISKVQEAKYWRVVYSNDMVPRVPFDDDIFEFKHTGYCYYYNQRYLQKTLAEAPNANYFSLSLKNIFLPRFVALYEVIVSLFSGWIYGPEFRENYPSAAVRLLGLISPGVSSHIMNNYVNAIRLGPNSLEAKLHKSEDRSNSLFPSISSIFSRKKQRQPGKKDGRKD